MLYIEGIKITLWQLKVLCIENKHKIKARKIQTVVKGIKKDK